MSTVVAVEYLSLDGGSWQRAAPVRGGRREQHPEAGETQITNSGVAILTHQPAESTA